MAKTEKTSLLFPAIALAAKAHHGQYRKGTSLPYLLHPLGVAKILIESGADDEVVAAGVLHDTVEDAGVSLAEIRELFGERVARLVASASEADKSDAWENRKRHTIAAVATAPLEVLLVEGADKLDNIRAIREDYERLGDGVWARFNRGRESQRWYYQSLAVAFLARDESAATTRIFEQFREEVVKVFGPIPSPLK